MWTGNMLCDTTMLNFWGGEVTWNHKNGENYHSLNVTLQLDNSQLQMLCYTVHKTIYEIDMYVFLFLLWRSYVCLIGSKSSLDP